MEVRVVSGEPAELTLDDGTLFRFAGGRLEIDGPERDYVVVADGIRMYRVSGSKLELDVSNAPRLVEFSMDEAPPPIPDRTHRIEPRAPGPGRPARLKVSGTTPRVRYRADPGGPEGEAFGEIPGFPSGTRVQYRVEGLADASPSYVYPLLDVPHVRPPDDVYSYLVGERRVPDWFVDGVVYHVLVDRFSAPPDAEISWLGFCGGTIRGLIERLDYVRDLGTDILWISPIFRAQMHVCYDVEDFFDVHPRLGSLDDAAELCRRAHEFGMRVLLDFEPSYVGRLHPFAVSARAAPDSPYREWFHTHDGRQFGWFGSQMLVALDHREPSVRAHLIEAARFWIDVGFDGFRLDSAHAAPMSFWTDFARDVPGFTVGEVMTSFERCLGYEGRLDAFLDFEMCNAIRSFIGRGEMGAEAFDEVVVRRKALGPGLAAPVFFENHDMDRFTFHAVDRPDERLKLALAALFTIGQTPVLYYGTEVGLGQDAPGDIDLIVRPPMLWGDAQDSELHDYVKGLIDLRRKHPALRRGTHRTIRAAGAIYEFEREFESDRIRVVLNANELTYETTA